jgi:hypothetical protein
LRLNTKYADNIIIAMAMDCLTCDVMIVVHNRLVRKVIEAIGYGE